MPPTPIRLGLIGTGGFAPQHLNAILALQKQGLARLQAIASLDEAMARFVLTSRGCTAPPIFTDYHAMTEASEFDAVAYSHQRRYDAYCARARWAGKILDIDEHLQGAAKRKVLLSDLGVPWATPTKRFPLPSSGEVR